MPYGAPLTAATQHCLVLNVIDRVWYFSGKGPSNPAPIFVGNIIAFLLNLVRIKCYIVDVEVG
jgi:hypothetical protein